MLNRRKAMIGWLVYSAAKPLAKQRREGPGEEVREGLGGDVGAGEAAAAAASPGSAARVVALAAVAGGLRYWRRSRSQDDVEPLT